MKLFREYFLDTTTHMEQTLYLPKDADIVKVNLTNKGLALLAIVTPEGCGTELPELRTFKICVNEENLYIYLKNRRPFVMLREYFVAEDYISRRLAIMNSLAYDTGINYDEVIDIAEFDNDII